MAKCAQCDATLPSSARFCPSCGSPIERADDTTQQIPALSIPALDQLEPGQAMLVVRSGPTAGSTIMLDAQEVSVGRSTEAGVFLDDVTVSRQHARFVRTADGWEVRDDRSLNGTYVNRERVEARRLESGDEIQVGRFRLSYHEALNG
jgi:pSer/pThr/pTyr-binding forkhead associated (FHA) protein